MESVNRTLDCIEDVQNHLLPCLSLFEPDAFALMQPLLLAQALLLLAKATSTILAGEIELISRKVGALYGFECRELLFSCIFMHAYKHLACVLSAPLWPSTTTLPDLTGEQKQSMRDVRHREVDKKRKYQYADTPSLQTAVKEFLEKSALELLGNDKGRLLGPVVVELSDDEEDDGLLME